MIYQQQDPDPVFAHLIKRFWWIDSEGDQTIELQKIVPDGYPELIFHYNDPYQINLDGTWQLQSKHLIAGQIRQHFFLKNTGRSGMFGIKLQPWSVYEIFGLDMSKLSDRVIPIELSEDHPVMEIISNLGSNKDLQSFISHCYHCFENIRAIDPPPLQQSIEKIIAKKGAITLKELSAQLNTSERSIERYFNKYIGLAPKFYSRIIRFAHIFELVKKHEQDWSAITYYAGYFDQSHFIRNFKEFTGEEPSAYGFNKQNMANFFFEH